MANDTKVFMDTQGKKYLGQKAMHPSDMHLPHVSPALLTVLSATPMHDIEIQEALMKKVSESSAPVLTPVTRVASGMAAKLAAVKAHQQAVQKEQAQKVDSQKIPEEIKNSQNELTKNNEGV